MRHFISLLTLFVTFFTMRAQTLDQCHSLATENYPEIKKYNLILATEQYNLSNASRAWIPQVVLSGQASYQSATPTYPEALNAMIEANGLEMSGIRKDQYKVAIDISQNIWDGGQSKASREIAKAEADEQRSMVDVSLHNLQTRVNNIFFGILLLEEREANTETLIGVLNNNLNQMRTYYNNGIATMADVDAIKAEVLTMQQTLEQVRASRACFRRMLEIFIGQPISDEKLSKPELASIESRNSARPELQLFDAQINKLNAQRKAINASTMPRFSAFAQGYYGYPGLDMFKSMVAPDWALNGIIGIRMSWNIGAYYTRKNNLSKLNAAEQNVAIQRDVFLFNTQLQVTQDDGEIARLQNTLNNDNQIVRLRKSVRQAAESKFQNGVIDTNDLLQKIADETTAISNRSTHEIELLQAIYRLKTTLNQ